MLENLDARRFLSVTTALSAGVLTVTSNEASDQVSIVAGNHGGIFVYANHHLVNALHSLSSIQVNLGDGDDSLDVSGINAPITVRGGAGNDHISGGHGADALFGEDGNDVIRAADGVGDTVDGGAGSDTAYTDHVDAVSNMEHVIHPSHHHPHAHLKASNRSDGDLLILAGLG
jgi:Ca2+-binding RTX toxin-like protein